MADFFSVGQPLGVPAVLGALVALGTGCAAVGWAALVAPGRAAGGNRRAMAPLLQGHYAHRGLHTHGAPHSHHRVPENSLAAFRASRDAGYGMELDVNLTADRQVAVFHDTTLERACGVPGTITDTSWDALRELRLFGTEHRIPLLEEVLQEIGGTVPLIVELKDTPRRYELCAAVAALLDGYPGPVCIESFHPGVVRWFRRHRPGMIRGQLSAGTDNFPEQTPFQRLLLTGLLTNVATRPHFVAYRHEDSRRRTRARLLLRLYRLLGGILIGWTVSDNAPQNQQEWCLQFFDAVIFEGIRP